MANNTVTTEKIKKRVLPCVATRQMVVFPSITVNLDIGRAFSKKACEAAMKDDGYVLFLCQKSVSSDVPTREELYGIGTVAKIKQLVKSPGNVFRVIAEPVSRAVVTSLDFGKYITAEVMEKTVTLDDGGLRGEALVRDLKNTLDDFVKYLPKFSKEMWYVLNSIKSPGILCDFVAANIVVDVDDKQALLEEFDPLRRLELLLLTLEKEKEILTEEAAIQKKVRSRLDRNQREYYLREQLKVIHEELGDDGDYDEETEEYFTKLSSGKYPAEVSEKLIAEIKKMQKMPYGSAEYSVIRSYIDTCLEIPFGKSTNDRLVIDAVRKKLDEDHDGLEKVKERIIEYLSALKLNPGLKNQIICLAGAPGTGKTSVAISIAKALKRNFVRVSLGGIRDEADIRGHRKTYIGAMPGRVIDALIQAKSMNPLILFDEIDKMTSDSRGDPASAMLEVLDGEQNKSFRDHFVELPVDLSECMFITTANNIDAIPKPLLDRMEIIELKTYTRDEKFAIAKHHLLKKQMKRHGLKASTFKIDDAVIYDIIDNYTREAGVRNLEREIAKCCRKAAKAIVSDGQKNVKITLENARVFLGNDRIIPERVPDCNEVGIANGMAWTEVGGDLLKTEALALEGTGKIELTGSIGNVMKESAETAISYVRSRARCLGIKEDFYKTKDIHIHFPEGAVPKDGPSAGITIATALVSELTGIPVRRDVAMTGEISLHGRVMAIGGLPEKTMAAMCAGAKTIIIPSDNVNDIEELPAVVRENCEIIMLSQADEVLRTALTEDPFDVSGGKETCIGNIPLVNDGTTSRITPYASTNNV